ncbi:MAG TPA: hypothetical protein DCZ94_07810 [Lentisphaeria bacterium]|nr:MAG: hypothetical protein A2X48_24210 [Lentisphaerae bacterium GWF2_49_21]HBC86842.1 hypothetical protein [Lentisphaeria bacterium]
MWKVYDVLKKTILVLFLTTTVINETAWAAEGNKSTIMPLPSDFDWTPLLKVIRTGPGKYAVDKTADDLRKMMYEGKTVTRYYVDPVNGKDSNSGLAQELALKTMQAAANRNSGDISEIIVLPPKSRVIWGGDATVSNGFAKSAIIYTLDGKDVIFCKGAKPAWTAAEGGTYTTTGPLGESNTSIVMDWSPAARVASPDGGGLGYERTANATGVAGRPGTFFHDTKTGLVTVYPFDKRNLVGDEYVTPPVANDLNCWSMSTPSSATAGRSYWVRNCHWVGGLNPLGMNNNSLAKARSILVFDHCGMWAGSVGGNAFAAVGPNDIYTFDCIGGYSHADLWNVHGNGLGSGRIFHVRPRCTVRNGYSGKGRDNVETGHEDSRGITVMPTYANSDGRVYGYIDRSRAMVFGGSIGPSLRTDDFCASVNSGGISVVDLYEVNLLPSKGPYTLTADGTKTGSGASIRCHSTDITKFTKHGANIVSEP